MINEERANQLISSFGLTQEEIGKLSIEGALSYLRFHLPKKDNRRTILFSGFSQTETSSLTQIALDNNFEIKVRFYAELTFICINDTPEPEILEKARNNGARILSKSDFQIIFQQGESKYNLQTNELLYDSSISPDFRIAKPLSNFDFVIKVNSFSLKRIDTMYDVNLFRFECTCDDFNKNGRSKYPRGDIRRLCRHLMYVYKTSFGVFEQSKFNLYLFENSFSYKKHIRQFVIEKTNQNVILLFDNAYDWWNIYIEEKNDGYKDYSYLPTQKGFAYNSKPIGIVPHLRTKLEQIHKELVGSSSNRKSNQKVEPQGCVGVFALIIVLTLVLKLVFT